MKIEVCRARMQGAPADLRPCGRCWACIEVKALAKELALARARAEAEPPPELPSTFLMRDGQGNVVGTFSVGRGRRGRRR